MGKMMKRVCIASMWISMWVLTGCYYWGPCLDGAGTVVTDIRDEDGFSGVSSSGSFDVYVSQAEDFSVEVVAQENLISIIETEVSGSTLLIRKKPGTCYRSISPVEIYVTLPKLEELHLSGSGKVIADVGEAVDFESSNTGSGILSLDTVIAATCTFSNSGSGRIEVGHVYTDDIRMIQSGSGSIYSERVYQPAEVTLSLSSSGRIISTIDDGVDVGATVSGSGRIELVGEAVVADYKLSASGKIDALDLMVEDAVATISGSGKILVYATETLDVTITASGDVLYRGNPVVTSQITGSGRVSSY